MYEDELSKFSDRFTSIAQICQLQLALTKQGRNRHSLKNLNIHYRPRVKCSVSPA